MDKQTENILFKVALIAGAYILIVKPVLQNFGILPTDAESQTNQNQQKALDQAAQNAMSQNPPTMDDGTLINIASRIYEDLRYSSLDDDKTDAMVQLARVQNTSDVYRLIQLFGTRQECYFGVLCHDQTLIQLVQGNLPAFQIAALNQVYQSKGINFQW